MKRFHVHVAVADVDASARFYSRLFDAEPTVRKPGYARWLLEDPRLNFAISAAQGRPGIDHLGLQVDSQPDLDRIRARMAAAGASITDEAGARCCYAVADKHWAVDPEGIAWEAFNNLAEAEQFGEDRGIPGVRSGPSPGVAAGCCGTPSTGCC